MNNKDIWGYFILSGFLLTISWVSIGDIYPLIFFAFVPIFFLTNDYILRKKNLRIIFFATYLAFFIWNICTTYWIYFASPYGAVGAVVLNTLFTSSSYMLGVYISRKYYKKLHFLPIASAWIAWEFLHQYWDLSWTWLTLGNVFAQVPLIIQWYEFTGVLGGSLWILGINFLTFKFLFRLKKSVFQQVVLLFLIPTFLSLLILNWRNTISKKQSVNVLVVQPNIDPYKEKFGPDGHALFMDAIKSIYISFKNRPVDHVLLPETAVSDLFGYSLERDSLILQGIWEHQLEKSKNLQEVKQLTARYFPKAKILGGMDAKSIVPSAAANPIDCDKIRLSKEDSDTTLCYKNHNAAFWISGGHFDFYNKSKLVVGVELFPFEPVLGPFFSSWMADLGGTSGTLGVSKEVKVFEDINKKIKVAPIICYESVYGSFVGSYVKKGANLLYIITNDAWWGNTPGHRQHQAYAQLRALETRKWIARSANTGISSFIDPLGKSYQNTSYNQKTGIYQKIHPNNIQTFYTIFGDYLAYFALLILFLYLFILTIEAKNKNKNKNIKTSNLPAI
jgi:apolipoprotein N-acyltransferase